jgi:hypothetical protein
MLLSLAVVADYCRLLILMIANADEERYGSC